MTKQWSCGLVVGLCILGLACSSGSNAAAGGTAGSGFPSVVGTGGVTAVGTGGSTATGLAGQAAPAGTGGVGMAGRGTAGMVAAAGAGGMGAAGKAAAGMGGMGAAGAAGKAGAGGAGGAGGGGGSGGGSAGNLTGTLGALGAAKPVVNGWATTNGIETLIYLSSSPLTCAMMMMQGTKWLATLPAGTQVIEIVLPTSVAAQSYPIGTPVFTGAGAEVNYAEGSKSSATETTGSAGSVMVTKAMSMMVYEGMINVTAPFMVSGTFHAEWCQGGTEY